MRNKLTDSGGYPFFIIHALYFMASATFCFLYFQKIVEPADFSAPNGINAVLSFETWKPYQFRLLIPFILKVLTPLSFIPQKAVFMAMCCAAVYFLVYVYHLILRNYFSGPIVSVLSALFILYPMTWNYVLLNQSFQYYDMFSVLFFVLGLYSIIKERFALLAVVFTAAIINKESAVYLIFSYAFFNYKNLFTKIVLLRTMILVLIFLSVKLVLSITFADNPGDTFEVTFNGNVDIFRNIFSDTVLAKNLLLAFGGAYVPVLLLFLTGRWKKFTGSSPHGLLYINLAVVPYLILGVFVVYFTEVRVYAELIPMVSTLSLIYFSSFGKPMIRTSYWDNS